MVTVHDDEDIYVCITHQCVVPCTVGEHHLISNWKTDVEKIMKRD